MSKSLTITNKTAFALLVITGLSLMTNLYLIKKSNDLMNALIHVNNNVIDTSSAMDESIGKKSISGMTVYEHLQNLDYKTNKICEQIRCRLIP